MGSPKGYIRPISVEQASFEKVNKGDYFVNGTIDSNAASLPNVPTYTSGDAFGTSVYCSGYPVLVLDNVGIIMEDCEVGTVPNGGRDVPLAFFLKRVWMKVKSTDTPGLGDQLAFDNATGELTTTTTGLPVVAMGLGTKEVLTSGNDYGLEAGHWVQVSLHPNARV